MPELHSANPSDRHLQRSSGSCRIVLSGSEKGNRIMDVYLQSPTRVLFPRTGGAAVEEAVLINTAGGAVILALIIALFVAWYKFRPVGFFINRGVHEGPKTAEGGSSAQTLASGTFHIVAHPTEGTAAIYGLADGRRVLRFTNFRTANGPDVHVYLVAGR